MNKKDRSFGSLKPIYCVVIDARAAHWVSFASLGNDASNFPWNSSPGPEMVAMSSLFCVSGICDFVVSTFFVMKSKWYPICLGENVQTTAKLYVVKKK